MEREEAVEGLALAASLSHRIQHSSGIVAMSWTHAGDGLLVSGKAGECAMYELPEEPVAGAAAQKFPIRYTSQGTCFKADSDGKIWPCLGLGC